MGLRSCVCTEPQLPCPMASRWGLSAPRLRVSGSRRARGLLDKDWLGCPKTPGAALRLGPATGGRWKVRGAGAGPQGESAEPTRSLPRPSAGPWGAPRWPPKVGGCGGHSLAGQGCSGRRGGVATPYPPQPSPSAPAHLLQGPGPVFAGGPCGSAREWVVEGVITRHLRLRVGAGAQAFRLKVPKAGRAPGHARGPSAAPSAPSSARASLPPQDGAASSRHRTATRLGVSPGVPPKIRPWNTDIRSCSSWVREMPREGV